jgi:hypothetical protein
MMIQTNAEKMAPVLSSMGTINNHEYRLGVVNNPDDPLLGVHYCYIERRVDAAEQPYVRDTFGEWMNFLELSLKSGVEVPDAQDPFGMRLATDALLNLIYAPSVIEERNILRGILDMMASHEYAVYAVDIVGRDDHLWVTLSLTNHVDVYTIDLTVNTK